MVLLDAWKKLYDHFKGDPSKLTLFTMVMLLVSETPIYFFTVLDALALPSLYKYRLHYAREVSEHLGTRVYPPVSLLKDVAKCSEFNFFMAYFIPGSIAIMMANKLKIHVYDTERELTWKRLIKEAFMISVVADFMFYLVHRFVHLPSMYLVFHKKHHEFKYSMALAHHYMTYKEALLFAIPQALPPIALVPFFGKMHIMSMWVGFFFTQLNAILGHAGWSVPWPAWVPTLKPAFHDYHHVDYKVNFAALYEFTDAIFGTLIRAPLASHKEVAARLGEKAFDYVKTAPSVKEWAFSA